MPSEDDKLVNGAEEALVEGETVHFEVAPDARTQLVSLRLPIGLIDDLKREAVTISERTKRKIGYQTVIRRVLEQWIERTRIPVPATKSTSSEREASPRPPIRVGSGRIGALRAQLLEVVKQQSNATVRCAWEELQGLQAEAERLRGEIEELEDGSI